MKIDFSKRFFWILLIVLIALTPLYISGWLNLEEHHSGDLVLFYLPRVESLRESISEYGDWLPLWSPYYFAGTSYIGKPISPLLNYLLTPLILLPFLSLGSLAAIKISIVLGTLIAGIGMFLLVEYLTKNKLAAFCSALVFMFNGFIIVRVFQWGWMVFGHAYPLIPFVMLFSFKIFDEKKPVFNSFIVGVLLALMIISGAGIIFLLTTLVIGIFLLFKIISRPTRKQLTKVIIFGLLLVLVAYGLSAFKIMPVREYLDMSARNLSYEESSGRSLTFQDIVPLFLNDLAIIPLLLILFGIITRWKNKNLLFFLFLMLFSILIAMRTPLQYYLWKFYPGWQGMRYASRNLVIFIFGGSVLAGYGVLSLVNQSKIWLKNKSGLFKSLAVIIPIALILNLIILGPGFIRIGSDKEPYEFRNIPEVIESNEILQDLAKKPGIFRIHILETRGIDWGTEFYTVPLKLEPLFGYETAWLGEYLNEYLSISHQNPAIFWGILNTKYLTSTTQQNIIGFKFLEEYNKCYICFPSIPELAKAYGPYLYENERFLPRAYLVDNSILVLGKEGDLSDQSSAKNIMYSMMLHPDFRPDKAIIILSDKEKISQFKREELSRFSAVFLGVDSYSSNDLSKLKDYVGQGGILLPDVTKDQTGVDDADLQELFSSFEDSSSFSPIPDENIETIDFDNKKIRIDDKGQWLVLSEKYSLFPGWSAIDNKNNEHKIYQADGIVSAVYLSGDEQELNFSYKLRSFYIGAWITWITLIIILVLLINHLLRYLKLKKEKESTHENEPPKDET